MILNYRLTDRGDESVTCEHSSIRWNMDCMTVHLIVVSVLYSCMNNSSYALNYLLSYFPLQLFPIPDHFESYICIFGDNYCWYNYYVIFLPSLWYGNYSTDDSF